MSSDNLVDVPLDADPSVPPADPDPPAASGSVRGEVVAGEEPEEEEEESSHPGTVAHSTSKSPDNLSEPGSLATTPAARVPRPRRNSEELKAEREKLERHHQQRKVLLAHNKTVREALLTALLGRLATGKAVCEDLAALFKAQSGYDVDFATHSRQAGEQFDLKSRQHPDVGSLRGALEALTVASAGVSTHVASIGDFGKTESLRRTLQLAQDLDARIKTMKEEAVKATKCLNAQIEKVNLLYRDYQVAIAAAEVGPPMELDPYVAGIQYQAALAELREAERAFTETLRSTVQDVDRLDRQRIDTLKSVLADYLQSRAKALESAAATLQTAAAVVDSVSTDDFLAFALTAQREIVALKPDAELAPYNFDVAAMDAAALQSQSAQLPSLLDATTAALIPCDAPIDRDFTEDVVREGWLKTKGRLLKAAKPVYAQLSRHGFLHLFAAKGGTTPDTSIALVRCEVETEKEEHTFCVQVKRAGMQVIGKDKTHLQADTQDQMVEWICAIKDCAQS